MPELYRQVYRCNACPFESTDVPTMDQHVKIEPTGLELVLGSVFGIKDVPGEPWLGKMEEGDKVSIPVSVINSPPILLKNHARTYYISHYRVHKEGSEVWVETDSEMREYEAHKGDENFLSCLRELSVNDYNLVEDALNNTPLGPKDIPRGDRKVIDTIREYAMRWDLANKDLTLSRGKLTKD